MREIEFRAKAKNKNMWVYGDLIHDENGYSILSKKEGCLKIKPNTIGQYTGLKDKNGKKIFEGDLIDYINEDLPAYVVYNYGEFELYNYDTVVSLIETRSYEMEVIGNIYDNPELLQGE